MKILYAIIDSIFHKEQKHEAWVGVKYLLVCGYKCWYIPHILGEERAYKTIEFHTKEEVLEYVDKYISKSDKKECRLYKEILL